MRFVERIGGVLVAPRDTFARAGGGRRRAPSDVALAADVARSSPASSIAWRAPSALARDIGVGAAAAGDPGDVAAGAARHRRHPRRPAWSCSSFVARRARAFDVAAYAWVPYLVVQLAGALVFTALGAAPSARAHAVMASGWPASRGRRRRGSSRSSSCASCRRRREHEPAGRDARCLAMLAALFVLRIVRRCAGTAPRDVGTPRGSLAPDVAAPLLAGGSLPPVGGARPSGGARVLGALVRAVPRRAAGRRARARSAPADAAPTRIIAVNTEGDRETARRSVDAARADHAGRARRRQRRGRLPVRDHPADRHHRRRGQRWRRLMRGEHVGGRA